jgi:hypothetical protein
LDRRELVANLDRYAAANHSSKLSQKVFKGAINADQIKNYWNNQAIEKYKAVISMGKHTGGADDGDAARVDGQDPAVVIGVDEDAEDKDSKDARKRALPKSIGNFSIKVLEEFERSDIFAMIDKVYVVSVLLHFSLRHPLSSLFQCCW